MNKMLEVVLKLTDQFTAPLRTTQGGVKSFGAELKNLVAGAVSLGAIGMGLRKAFEAADEYRVALQKLEGTAKITGVPLQFLSDLAQQAANRFGLSKVQASDFAVEMAKLATKAGDVGKAGPALQAFLDIGAARGLTAAETLKAVQQAILGIDEGTDKLFNANPSVLYAAFAAEIGTTAAKLTDQQKAQALLNAAMTDGGKVMGEYSKWLGTTAGQIQLAKNRTDEAYASLGLALDGARQATASAVAWIAGGLQAFVGGLQLIGNNIGFFFARLPAEIEVLWRGLLIGVAWGVEKLGSLIPFVGDKMEEAGRKMGAEQRTRMRETVTYLDELKKAQEEAAFEIVGIASNGEVGQTAALRTGISDRAKLSEGEKKANEAREKQAHAALQKLRDTQAKAQLESMTVLGRELHELKATFDQAMLSEDAATQEESKRLWQKAVADKMAAYAELVPQVRGYTLQVRGELATVPPVLHAGSEAVQQHARTWDELMGVVGETAGSIGDGAYQILDFARQVGAATPQVEALVGGVTSLADGIKGISGATDFGSLLTGIGGVFAGLQGILGGLFGDSPAEQARKALLRENSQRLRELKAEIGDLLNMNQSGAMLAKFEGLTAGMAQFTAGGDSKHDEKMRTAAFAQFLFKQGLTLTDAEQLAKDMGVQLVGEDNRLSAGAVAQFIEAIRNSEFSQFDQSFSGQQDFMDSLFGIGGDNPESRLTLLTNRLLGPQGAFSFFAPLLANGQASTAEGRATIRDAMVDALNQMNAGGFDTALFGQLTGAEFVEAMQTLADLFTELDGVTSVGTTGTFAPVTASSFSGVSFTTDSIDIRADFVMPIARIATGIERLVELGQAPHAVQVYIQNLNAGSIPDAAGVMVTAINEELRIQRDLNDLTQGQ